MLIRPHLSPADNRRIQAMLLGNQNGDLRQQLLDGAPFLAELTHTAVPQRAATGTTATFTRATTKTWPNNDGYLVTGVSGEIGFVGARRVDNLIRLGAAQSSTLAVAANVTMTLPAGAYQFSMGAGTGRVTFSGTGGATGTLDAVTTGRVHVAKTITAGTLIVTASVATLVDIQVVSMVAETDQTTIREYVSVGVPSDWAGTDLVTNGTFDTDTDWTTDTNITIGGGVMTCTLSGTSVGTSFSVVAGTKYVVSWDCTRYVVGANRVLVRKADTTVIGGGTQDTTGVTATGRYIREFTSDFTGTVQPQVEFPINGESDVDNVVIKPAYYHGSGVDGVKCFPTDLAGNPLTTMLGYLAEGARTNKCLYSENFNRVEWNLTGGNFTATDSGIPSPIAGVNWQKLTVVATAATNISQSISAAGSAAGNTYSVFMKKGSGATVANTFGIYNLTTAADVWFGTINYDTGFVTKLTGSGDAVVEHLGNNAYRISISPTSGISAGNSLTVYVGYSGNPGTAGDYLYALGAMLEDGSFASSYIPTTTVAVTRNADVLTYSSAGNIDGTKGWCYAEFDVSNDSDGNQNIILGSDVAGVFPLYAQPSLGNVRTLDGTNAPIAQSAPMTGVRKGAGTWGGSTMQSAHNGVVSSTTAFDGNMEVTAVIRIGEDNAGNSHFFGTIKNLYIGQRQLSASELQAVTA